MRVLQSKGVADHIERHIEILTELTRRERECFYCVSAPLKQSYSKSHLNGNTEDNEQEMKMRITSVFFLIPRSKEKNAITGQTAQGGSKRWFLSNKFEIIIIARPHNESTKSLAKTPSVKTGGGT